MDKWERRYIIKQHAAILRSETSTGEQMVDKLHKYGLTHEENMDVICTAGRLSCWRTQKRFKHNMSVLERCGWCTIFMGIISVYMLFAVKDPMVSVISTIFIVVVGFMLIRVIKSIN